MIDQKLIDRINYLANKAKTDSLTEKEKQEQKLLREEYIQQFRKGFKGYLNNVDFVDEDGNKIDLNNQKKPLN